MSPQQSRSEAPSPCRMALPHRALLAHLPAQAGHITTLNLANRSHSSDSESLKLHAWHIDFRYRPGQE